MKRLHALVLIAVLLFVAPAYGQTAGDVSVHLFSTHAVHALTLAPSTSPATVKVCNACVPEVLHAPAKITQAGSSFLFEGKPLRSVELNGALHVETDTDKTAIAAGKWRIDVAHGELRVLIQIPRERYVMAVLASESAPDDPPAALQALAVVIRSFSFAEAHRHAAEGFDMCDSTHCQVMQLGPVAPRIQAATLATAGETLWLHGARVAAYFTQHCGGISEDASEAWGGPHRAWLIAHADAFCQRAPSQWHAEVPLADLRASLEGEGWPLHADITAIRIISRSTSGRALRLQVIAGGEKIALAAASFRFAVDRSLGWNNLRSDWYTLSLANGRVIFDGKGFGHGVGLCQAGARQMALDRSGDPAQIEREILSFYFPGTVVRISIADMGWQKKNAGDWTLISATPTPAVIQAGNAAWSRARTLFPPQTPIHPIVRVAPDTELFRQITNEPGWTLGATRGLEVVLQPNAVITKHESLQAALLHEFLHVLVEQEAAVDTPLWFREGLVEYLAAPAQAKDLVHESRVQDIERSLQISQSWQQADIAHRFAADLVAGLVGRYGLATVRGWLHAGVPAGALTR